MSLARFTALFAIAACAFPVGDAEAVGLQQQRMEKALELRRKEGAAAKAEQEARRKAVGTWWRCLGRSVAAIQRHGAGGYSTSSTAREALMRACEWDSRTKRPVFHLDAARPSFCSGAVYLALLYTLAQWDSVHEPRMISPEAWQALLPAKVADGEGPWGWANANGPGFAALVHRLGAGVSFTDPAKARPGDFMKIWWNDTVGAGEHGHLVVFVEDKGDKVRVWSSNKGNADTPDGFGFKTYSKTSIKRVIYTRITNPAAFNNAPRVGVDEWLGSLLRRNVSWEECLQHAGVR